MEWAGKVALIAKKSGLGEESCLFHYTIGDVL